MKKDYCKPKAVVQNLAVNCFIAGACSDVKGVAVLNFSEDSCTYFDEESFMTYFSQQCESEDGLGVNIVNPNPQSPFAQLCYHRPLDVLNFFNS